MREIDLSKYKTRTDLVVDLIEKDQKYEEIDEYDSVKVSRIKLDKKGAEKLGRKKGNYTTIYFEDITDSTNYLKTLEIFTNELKKMLKKTKIKLNHSCMVIGLGNEKSTADLLGVETSKKVIVTNHIYKLTGSLEDGYRITTSISPGVMGETGIETSEIISSVIKTVSPDFVITIDALASDSIDRLLRTIQITDTGINPGSGIGNNRKEVSKEIFNIPVIAIGVPTVVEATTIVNDTINYMKKHFSYNIKNKDNPVTKLVPSNSINYLKDNTYNLSEDESNYFLGAIGNLSNSEKKSFIKDVLTPIGYNLIVTPKEIDFVVEKLISLLSSGINNTLHNISTK